MRKVLNGTVRGIAYGVVSIHVGALSDDEKRHFTDATVEVRRADTPETLLQETFRELAAILGRHVLNQSRDERLSSIRSRALEKGFLKSEDGTTFQA